MQPTSSRLSYSFITEKNVDDLFDLDQDPSVMKYLNGGRPSTLEEIHTVFLPRLSKYANKEKGRGLWKVSITETKAFIGWILVRPMYYFNDARPTENHNLELGWRFKQCAWGNGYATEAAQALIAQIKRNTQYSHISAIAVEENVSSVNIMKKLGMTFIEQLLHRDPLGDTFAVHYSKQL
jgi:RimJ/RimL family protein N-acetyltransferase